MKMPTKRQIANWYLVCLTTAVATTFIIGMVVLIAESLGWWIAILIVFLIGMFFWAINQEDEYDSDSL